jgi:hypothetical protein
LKDFETYKLEQLAKIGSDRLALVEQLKEIDGNVQQKEADIRIKLNSLLANIKKVGFLAFFVIH